jgi:hypothetical protein
MLNDEFSECDEAFRVQISHFRIYIPSRYGGEGGIRTHGTVASSRALQARRFVHSRTSPARSNLLKGSILSRDPMGGKARAMRTRK